MTSATTAVLLEQYRAVYVEVPKVACSSIKIALAGLLGIDLAASGGDPHKAPLPTPASRPSGSALYPGLFSFAFVRNPWDRLVSCYRDKILGEAPDFTSFHPTRGVAYCLARFGAFRAGMTFEDFVAAVAAIPDACASSW
jgi:chondroitin 4-sulfotransferase 11